MSLKQAIFKNSMTMQKETSEEGHYDTYNSSEGVTSVYDWDGKDFAYNCCVMGEWQVMGKWQREKSSY